jgi:hypothetical protein
MAAGNCWLLQRAVEEEGNVAVVIEPRAYALRAGGREACRGIKEEASPMLTGI